MHDFIMLFFKEWIHWPRESNRSKSKNNLQHITWSFHITWNLQHITWRMTNEDWRLWWCSLCCGQTCSKRTKEGACLRSCPCHVIRIRIRFASVFMSVRVGYIRKSYEREKRIRMTEICFEINLFLAVCNLTPPHP